MPNAIFEAPEEALIGFLQGLFDADGCVVNQQANGTRYVGLGSRPRNCCIDVQELLASLGMAAVSTGPAEEGRQLPLHAEGRLAAHLRLGRPEL